MKRTFLVVANTFTINVANGREQNFLMTNEVGNPGALDIEEIKNIYITPPNILIN